MTEEIIQKKQYWVEFISFSKKHCNYTDEDLAEHIVKMINKAINYTRCSTQLPSKYEITFDEYLKLKKIEHTERGVYKWEGSFYNDTYIKKCYEIYKM